MPNAELEETLSRAVDDPIAGTFVQLVMHLGHYRYAMAQMREAPLAGIIGFYSDSVLRMIGDWFGKPKEKGEALIESALGRVGMGNHVLNPIDRLLDTAVASRTTWRHLIKDYRNLAVSHNIFAGDIQKQVCQLHGLEPRTVESVLIRFLDDMADSIEHLQSAVEQAFDRYDPELYLLLREMKMFRSTEKPKLT